MIESAQAVPCTIKVTLVTNPIKLFFFGTDAAANKLGALVSGKFLKGFANIYKEPVAPLG